MSPDQFDEYVDVVAMTREEWAGRVDVRLGLEAKRAQRHPLGPGVPDANLPEPLQPDRQVAEGPVGGIPAGGSRGGA